METRGNVLLQVRLLITSMVQRTIRLQSMLCQPCRLVSLALEPGYKVHRDIYLAPASGIFGLPCWPFDLNSPCWTEQRTCLYHFRVPRRCNRGRDGEAQASCERPRAVGFKTCSTCLVLPREVSTGTQWSRPNLLLRLPTSFGKVPKAVHLF